MAEIIDGKQVAGEIAGRVKQLTAELITETGVAPGLAVVIVGEDPASQVYVAAKSKKAKDCGFHSVQHTLPAETTQDELVALVEALNADPAVHGILVQFPVPPQIDQQIITQAISPDKDVDGLHVVNIGRLAGGLPGFVPCTPAGAMILTERRHGRDLSGLTAVVIGRSNLVGKPLAALLTAANATVTIAHSKTKDLPAVARSADILVAAVGRPEIVKADWIKPGATVLDIGINRVPAPEKGKNAAGEDQFKLAGDVAFDEALSVAGAVTPVPGGIGPMTIAMLMANTLVSAFRSAGREPPRF